MSSSTVWTIINNPLVGNPEANDKPNKVNSSEYRTIPLDTF
jgi:hypothetical protein